MYLIKPKLIVVLKGGIGNQLFQYACAQKLALHNNCELLIDTYSGFIFDFKFKRKYELYHFNIENEKANIFHIILYWLIKTFLFINKLFKIKFIKENLYSNFIFENSHNYSDIYLSKKIDKIKWVEGYWQSYKYFEDISSELTSLLSFKEQLPSQIKNLGNKMKSESSIAICIRLYEEVATPSIQSITGNLKTFDEINNVIKILSSKVINPTFYVFTINKDNVFDKLNLPKESTFYITADNDFKNTNEVLWLQSQCKHHIITNSTFYWWGAWLSKENHNDQVIYIDKNFLNQDILYNKWIKY